MYVVLKLVQKLWGSENIFSKNMGVRKYFGKKYGGSIFFAIFWKLPPTGYPVLKKTNPLSYVLSEIFVFEILKELQFSYSREPKIVC